MLIQGWIQNFFLILVLILNLFQCCILSCWPTNPSMIDEMIDNVMDSLAQACLFIRCTGLPTKLKEKTPVNWQTYRVWKVKRFELSKNNTASKMLLAGHPGLPPSALRVLRCILHHSIPNQHTPTSWACTTLHLWKVYSCTVGGIKLRHEPSAVESQKLEEPETICQHLKTLQ